MSEKRGVRVELNLTCDMERTIAMTGETVLADLPFHGRTIRSRILESTDLDTLYEMMVQRILERMPRLTRQGAAIGVLSECCGWKYIQTGTDH